MLFAPELSEREGLKGSSSKQLGNDKHYQAPAFLPVNTQPKQHRFSCKHMCTENAHYYGSAKSIKEA